MKLTFYKYHGLGNDFVMFDDMDQTLELTPEQVQHICDRHFGIGADGVILVRPSKRDECVAYMHYINSDGTLAEMCGNGIRCFARFLVDRGYIAPEVSSFVADTLRGPLSLELERDSSGNFLRAVVDMDEPILQAAEIPTTLKESFYPDLALSCVREQSISSPWGDFSFTCVSMGNPHAVCFLDTITSLPDTCFTGNEKTLETFKLDEIGAYFECHPAFPAKSNIEFIVVGDNELLMRVFERGCGETLACGTGACASLVAAVLTNRSKRHNKVHLRGGILDITWSKNNHVYMAGPAVCSFAGTLDL